MQAWSFYARSLLERILGGNTKSEGGVTSEENDGTGRDALRVREAARRAGRKVNMIQSTAGKRCSFNA